MINDLKRIKCHLIDFCVCKKLSICINSWDYFVNQQGQPWPTFIMKRQPARVMSDASGGASRSLGVAARRTNNILSCCTRPSATSLSTSSARHIDHEISIDISIGFLYYFIIHPSLNWLVGCSTQNWSRFWTFCKRRKSSFTTAHANDIARGKEMRHWMQEQRIYLCVYCILYTVSLHNKAAILWINKNNSRMYVSMYVCTVNGVRYARQPHRKRK